MLNWSREADAAINAVLSKQPIILVDVGASGAPPRSWQKLAPLAYYVGFDPDLRELREDNAFGFQRFIMLNKAVSSADESEIRFFLTASPFCSSCLPPNPDVVDRYSFTDLFRVERTASVAATTLSRALNEFGLEYIDCLKLDSQGKDLDIYLSLDADRRARLLVLGIEPGVLDFYVGENTFAAAHARLVKDGYWLSRAAIQDSPRISKATRTKLVGERLDFDSLPASPTAIDAQYFRTLECLLARKAPVRDQVCIWVLAMVNDNLGFALDVAASLADSGAEGKLGEMLIQETIAEIRRRATASGPFWSTAKALVPRVLHPLARRLMTALRRR